VEAREGEEGGAGGGGGMTRESNAAEQLLSSSGSACEGGLGKGGLLCPIAMERRLMRGPVGATKEKGIDTGDDR
jgi:hypothetical protein